MAKCTFDVDAFFGAIESKKSTLGISWHELAASLEMPDETVFGRMSRGETPDIDTVFTLSAWLGSPLEHYVRGEVPSPDSLAHTIQMIEDALREGRPDADESVLRAAHAQLTEKTAARASQDAA